MPPDIDSLIQKIARSKYQMQEAAALRLVSRVLGPVPFPLNPSTVSALATAKGVEFTRVTNDYDLKPYFVAARRPVKVGQILEVLDQEESP